MRLDDVIAATSQVFSGGITGDPFSDPFDPNRTALHGRGQPAGPFSTMSPYSLDLFTNYGAGMPWWWDETRQTPGTGGQPVGTGGGTFDPVAWMDAYPRGEYPYSSLVSLGPNNRPSTNGQWYVRPDTAAAFNAMDGAFFKQTGEHLTKYLVSAFRNFGTPYETSRGMDWHGSDHAAGGAIDVVPGSIAEKFILAHGDQFGFGNDGAGVNWGDPGHHSFTAGGFHGWSSNYTGPSDADKQWIAAASGSTGGGGGMPSFGPHGPIETMIRRPAISEERMLALVPAANVAGVHPGPVPPYQIAFPMALAGMLTPDSFSGRRGSKPPVIPSDAGLGRRLDALTFPGSQQKAFEKLKAYFLEAGRATGIDPKLLVFVALHESGFNPGVCSGAGYCGVMQIKGSTHPNWQDPAANIMEGAKELLGWMQLAQSRGVDPITYGLAYYNVGGYADQATIEGHGVGVYAAAILKDYRAA
jgi:hypothetical protein